MSVDALDAAEIGEVVRRIAAESFWDWFEEPCDGVAAPPRDSEEAQRAFSDFTAWLNNPSGRDLGDSLVKELERIGFEVRGVERG